MQHPTTTHHGITIDQVQMPAGNPFRASCLCGWASRTVASRPDADAEGTVHLHHVRSAELDALEPTPPACPPWCRFHELVSGPVGRDHGYDYMNDADTWSRFHINSAGEVQVGQEEINRGGIVDLLPAHVSVWAHDGKELRAAEARACRRAAERGGRVGPPRVDRGRTMTDHEITVAETPAGKFLLSWACGRIGTTMGDPWWSLPTRENAEDVGGPHIAGALAGG